MDLKGYLAQRAEAVNKALRESIPSEAENPKNLHGAMHYSLFAGGKRLRPILLLAANDAIGGDMAAAMPAACAFECIHTYSLIHDDLPAIDNDDLRRGQATCHKAWGEAVAILAGDALLTIAFELLARTPQKSGEKSGNGMIASIVAEVAKAAGSTGMIGGQVIDIESEGMDIDFPVLEYIHIHKTGELMLASIRCGAMIAGATPAQLDALTRYGRAAGLAFQIADDLLDVEGDSVVMGKSVGGDAKKGKATYPSLIGVEESRKRALELAEIAIGALEGFDHKADPLREIARYIVSRKS